jgi:hypothetical protein
MLALGVMGLCATAAHAEDNPAFCATAAPELRRLAIEAASFTDHAAAALPADLAAALRAGDEALVSEMLADTGETSPLASAMRDYVIALVRLHAPLAEYNNRLTVAANAAEACAAAR